MGMDTLIPTDVPQELAESFAPTAKASRKEIRKPRNNPKKSAFNTFLTPNFSSLAPNSPLISYAVKTHFFASGV